MYAQSVNHLAGRLGIPRWIVDIRHEVTHDKLSSLQILREAAFTAIHWCHQNYWLPQYTGMMALVEKQLLDFQLFSISPGTKNYEKILNDKVFRHHEYLRSSLSAQQSLLTYIFSSMLINEPLIDIPLISALLQMLVENSGDFAVLFFIQAKQVSFTLVSTKNLFHLSDNLLVRFISSHKNKTEFCFLAESLIRLFFTWKISFVPSLLERVIASHNSLTSNILLKRYLQHFSDQFSNEIPKSYRVAN